MRIAIFGAGGVGGYFGACLARAGEEVGFVARGEHLRAMATTGLQIRSPLGDFKLDRVRATHDASQLAPVDLVLLAIKAWQLPQATPALASLLGPSTFVLPLLNGIETSTCLEAVLGPGRVLKGLTRIVSRISTPGVITHVGVQPTIVFKEPDNTTSTRIRRLRDLLENAGIRAVIPEDVDRALWEKFIFVVAVGGVGAVSRANVGVMRQVAETRGLLTEVMEEIYDLARVRGVNLKEDTIPRAMKFLDDMPADATASLQRDLAAGRPSELEAWTGAVVRLGRESGLPKPRNDFIHSSLLPLERRARGHVKF
ncbi:MAG: 2-dehydropantoate 2-reductase [Acidobacteria bacterium]|nr:2-dehydropantoate 2-reductase [Acidobacteriota bacterium]